MSDEATETPSAAEPRYDILLVSQNRAFNIVEQGLKALINFMQATGYTRVYDEAVADKWAEIYCKPGPSAHNLFVTGAYSGTEPLFLETAIRGGTVPVTMPFGQRKDDETCYFWIEIRGALFKDLIGKAKLKLRDVLHTRFDIYSRPHVELPPHATVGDDEAPVDRKRKKGGPSTRVGTAVEEF